MRSLGWSLAVAALPLLYGCGGGSEVEPVVDLEMTVPPAGAEVETPGSLRESQLSEAREAGFEYWAIGNEPGWTLRAGEALLVWVTDYGQTTYEVETPGRSELEGESGAAYLGELEGGEPEGGELGVTFLEEPCSDDMSGEAFGVRVVIEHGDRVYRGCGERLTTALE